MAYEQKPGDIAIFAEREKRNDRAPDWKGTMIVPDGVQPGDKLEVAFWAKGSNGTMLAGSVKPQRGTAPGDDTREFRSGGTGGVSGGGGYGSGQGLGGQDHGGARVAHQRFDIDDEIPF